MKYKLAIGAFLIMVVAQTLMQWAVGNTDVIAGIISVAIGAVGGGLWTGAWVQHKEEMKQRRE